MAQETNHNPPLNLSPTPDSLVIAERRAAERRGARRGIIKASVALAGAGLTLASAAYALSPGGEEDAWYSPPNVCEIGDGLPAGFGQPAQEIIVKAGFTPNYELMRPGLTAADATQEVDKAQKAGQMANCNLVMVALGTDKPGDLKDPKGDEERLLKQLWSAGPNAGPLGYDEGEPKVVRVVPEVNGNVPIAPEHRTWLADDKAALENLQAAVGNPLLVLKTGVGQQPNIEKSAYPVDGSTWVYSVADGLWEVSSGLPRGIPEPIHTAVLTAARTFHVDPVIISDIRYTENGGWKCLDCSPTTNDGQRGSGPYQIIDDTFKRVRADCTGDGVEDRNNEIDAACMAARLLVRNGYRPGIPIGAIGSDFSRETRRNRPDAVNIANLVLDYNAGGGTYQKDGTWFVGNEPWYGSKQSIIANYIRGGTYFMALARSGQPIPADRPGNHLENDWRALPEFAALAAADRAQEAGAPAPAPAATPVPGPAASETTAAPKPGETTTTAAPAGTPAATVAPSSPGNSVIIGGETLLGAVHPDYDPKAPAGQPKGLLRRTLSKLYPNLNQPVVYAQDDRYVDNTPLKPSLPNFSEQSPTLAKAEDMRPPETMLDVIKNNRDVITSSSSVILSMPENCVCLGEDAVKKLRKLKDGTADMTAYETDANLAAGLAATLNEYVSLATAVRSINPNSKIALVPAPLYRVVGTPYVLTAGETAKFNDALYKAAKADPRLQALNQKAPLGIVASPDFAKPEYGAGSFAPDKVARDASGTPHYSEEQERAYAALLAAILNSQVGGQ